MTIHNRIVLDPTVLVGKLVVKGMRLAVEFVIFFAGPGLGHPPGQGAHIGLGFTTIVPDQLTKSMQGPTGVSAQSTAHVVTVGRTHGRPTLPLHRAVQQSLDSSRCFCLAVKTAARDKAATGTQPASAG